MTVFLRGMFVLLILLAVRARVEWYRMQNESDPGQIRALVNSVTKIGLHAYGPDRAGVVYAVAANCPAPAMLGLIDKAGKDAGSFAPLQVHSMVPLFIYLGTVTDRPERRWFAEEKYGADAEAVLGLRGSVPPRKVTVVVLPDKCPQLARLDWKSLSPWG